MGVANTLPNYKSFTFDGTNSRAYGVYITGRGVFNAPERNVEMVEIPGRNGAYALDKGNFNNIEVTYPAGIFADTEADFAQAVSDLRNFLCSKSGYCRLEDDYNSGEYRMAIYKSGLEVDHDMLTAGEFNIVFECKPQRWLTSGETATAVTSGGKVTNPTLFDAKPQLQVWGYGDIDLGGQEMSVGNVLIGTVLLASQTSGAVSLTQTLDVDSLDTGDDISVSGASVDVVYTDLAKQVNKHNSSVTSATDCTGYASGASHTNRMGFALDIDSVTFAKGTSSTRTFSASATIGYMDNTSDSVTITGSVVYDGTDTLTYSVTATALTGATLTNTATVPDIFGNSTKSALGSPLYIDLDTGEAYKIENNTAVSVNNAVQIPAELPVLPPGDTTITYDNTITQFKVLPRWWKV